MKACNRTTISRLFILLTLLALLAFPASALAAGPQEGRRDVLPDQFVFGDNYTLEEGQTLSGNLFLFGGSADLRRDSRVTGDVMVLGGNLSVDGTIEGDIQVLGGNVSLLANALVRGDVGMAGGNISRDRDARVEGDVSESTSGPFVTVPRSGVTPNVEVVIDPIARFIWFMMRSFAMAALAVLVVLFLPRHTERVAQTSARQPIVAGGLGLLTLVVSVVLMVVMSITLILIPVALLASLVLGIAVTFGWIAIGLEVGKRLASVFKTEWAPPLAAGVGTLLITIVLGAIGEVLICIGWVLPFTVTMIGLGAVLLTRFGSTDYPSYVASIVPVPAPYTPVTTESVPYRYESETPDPPSGAVVYPLDEDDR